MSVRSNNEAGRKKKSSRSALLLRVLRYMSAYRKETVAVILIMMASALILTYLPTLMQNAVDVQIANRDMAGLVRVTMIFIVLVIFWWLLYIARVRIIGRVSNKVVLTIRDEVFAHLQTLGLYFFDSRPTGTILSRLIGDITSLKEMLNQLVVILVPNVFFILCISVAMFLTDAHLALGAFVSLPVIVIGTFAIMGLGYPLWQSFHNKQGDIAGYSHEAFSGMKIIQSFSAEEESRQGFERINNEVYQSWVKAVRLMDTLGIVIDLSQAIGYVMLYVVAIYRLRIDASSVGELIAFATYISLFWQPVRQLANMYNQLASNLAAASRVFELLDEKSALCEDTALPDLPSLDGAVTFKDVTFAYPDEPERNVLEKLSFSVRSGEHIALVGPTGAGKTTIINLLSRFYEPVEGCVLIDGHDISRYSLASLRGQVGVMTQESYLFSGTILENIRYGMEGATEEEVREACLLTGADGFISRLTDGYYTEVSSSSLSQGQKQLVALSRTILKNPRILILDEATSSIDTHTELLVQKGIAKVLEGRTSFTVAHRLSTIRNSDRIFVVDQKGILEEGSHDELLARGGAYAALYNAQFS